MPLRARFFARLRGYCSRALRARSSLAGTCSGAHLRREVRVHGAWIGSSAVQSSAVPIPGLVHRSGLPWLSLVGGLGSLVRPGASSPFPGAALPVSSWCGFYLVGSALIVLVWVQACLPLLLMDYLASFGGYILYLVRGRLTSFAPW